MWWLSSIMSDKGKNLKIWRKVKIDGVSLADQFNPYVIAEMSGNHSNKYKNAEKLLNACVENGASAFKLQTYTPDSMTLDSRRSEYIVGKGPWEGRNLYELYSEGQTPADWIPDLFQTARDLGISIFSTPFSLSDVDILENNNVSAYKIASFEITYIQLLKYIAKTGKPIIFSTGLAKLEEIQIAVDTLIGAGARDISILKCSTNYPAQIDSLNLNTIPYLADKYGVPIGFSDHTIGPFAAIAAVSLGATILEKHVKLDEDQSSVDASFSLPVSELDSYIKLAKNAALSKGEVQDGPAPDEKPYLRYRRSVVASRDIAEGETLSAANLSIVRPDIGLAPVYYDEIIGLKAIKPIEFGEGVTLDKIETISIN